MAGLDQKEIQRQLDIHDWQIIEGIAEQYGRLMDWFKVDFPEGTIRLDVNSDQRIGALKYKLTVMTGKEATPQNQGLMSSEVVITREKFTDLKWIHAFKNELYERYKREIIRRMNQHYNLEKERVAAQ